MGEALLLTMDGSTSLCCASLLSVADDAEVEAGQVVSRRSETNGRGQARILLRQVDEMLREVGAEPADLAKIIVGTGPGTFTGVRIAVATARGLSIALGVPVFGVSTLSSLAAWALEAASEADRQGWSSVVPVVDARRGQVFYTVYECRDEASAGEGLHWVMTRPIAVSDRETLGEKLQESRPDGTMVVVGDGDVIGSLSGEMHLLTGGVRAEHLALGQQRLVGMSLSDGEDTHADASDAGDRIGTPESVKPIYVRAPDADIHITKMRDPWARESTGK